MTNPHAQPLRLLQDIAGRPAVSYHEGPVASCILDALRGLGLEPEADAHGNILAHVQGADPGVPPIAFVAHMDHPGFEAIEVDGGRLVAQALGGVPASCFSAPVPVLVGGGEGGRWLSGTLDGPCGPPDARRAYVRLAEPQPVRLPAPIVFDLPAFSVDGGLVRMRAADDLAGCAAALAALHGLASRPAPGDVYGLFTRAEEVGLVGARLAAAEGRLPRGCLVVSLESSRELPGAVIGGGPVIRVGDATFTFSAEAEQVLHVARRSLAERDPGLKVQRQLMSGGTCEASAFAAHGYAATGVAFPLGNYHNAGPEGRVEPEYISAADFLAGVRLVEEAARSVRERGASLAWQRLRGTPEEGERLRW